MPDIKDSVGEGTASNQTHDVALVQAMLKVIKNAKGHSYLTTNYDGSYGKITKAAIIKLQKDHKIIPADPKKAAAVADKIGFISKNGPTIKIINKLLPASHKSMTIIANTKTVYLAGDVKDAKASSKSIKTDANLDATFRIAVGKLVDAMYDQHKIVLKTTATGRRRTLAQQALILPPASWAGPGESNHNFGHAVDIGFRHLQWVKGDGTIHKDADWLNALEKTNIAKAKAFWDTRDGIAMSKKIGLFALKFERVHLQDYDQKTVSSARSLAKLLNTVGTSKWQAVPAIKNNTYKNDLTYGKGMFNVGKACNIQNGKANVTAAMLAAAKGVKITAIQQKHINAAKVKLQKDFYAAEKNWKKWKGVP